MAVDIAPDTPFTSLSGDTRPLEEWTTTFHLALVVLDPFTYESAWILATGGRILRTFAEADCRTAFVVTCDVEAARQFIGPWADDLLVFVDPDRLAVKGLGLEQLPAFVHVNQANQVEAKAEGWDPGCLASGVRQSCRPHALGPAHHPELGRSCALRRHPRARLIALRAARRREQPARRATCRHRSC